MKKILALALLMPACARDSNHKTIYVPADTVAIWGDEIPESISDEPIVIIPSETPVVTDTPVVTPETPAETPVAVSTIWLDSKITLCDSEVMSSGKQLHAIIEQRADGMRHFSVKLSLDGKFYQTFSTYDSPDNVLINKPIQVGIDDTIKAAYGLGEDSSYLMAYAPEAEQLRVSGMIGIEVTDRLGVPPAHCRLLETSK